MIERVIFTPEADDDVAASYDWYESQEPGLVKTFFARLKLVLAAFSAIPRCIRSPSMSFVVPRFAAFHLRFSTSRLSIAVLSTLYFTAHKIQRSGGSVSAIEHTRLILGRQPTA